jgi:hypothetical protein
MSTMGVVWRLHFVAQRWKSIGQLFFVGLAHRYFFAVNGELGSVKMFCVADIDQMASMHTDEPVRRKGFFDLVHGRSNNVDVAVCHVEFHVHMRTPYMGDFV